MYGWLALDRHKHLICRLAPTKTLLTKVNTLCRDIHKVSIYSLPNAIPILESQTYRDDSCVALANRSSGITVSMVLLRYLQKQDNMVGYDFKLVPHYVQLVHCYDGAICITSRGHIQGLL